MSQKAKHKKPEIIIRDGKPASVINDIEDYREMLERLEDTEDLKMLEKMRSGKLKFRKLEDFLQESRQGV